MRILEPTPSAYSYPLLIKHLLPTARAQAARQEIVYADRTRYDYRTLRRRISRLASGLSKCRGKPDDTVAVMDWESQRYLESSFPVPMSAPVLNTFNIHPPP